MDTQEMNLSTFVLGPIEGRTPAPLDVLGEEVVVKIAGDDTGGRVAMFHLTVPPMSGPPLHRHSREDEWFYVLDGEIAVQIDGRRTLAGPGSSALAARGTAHTFQNFTQTTAHMLVMVTPAGLDRFFAGVSAANRGLSAPDLVRVEKLMNEYGLELLGPPLA